MAFTNNIDYNSLLRATAPTTTARPLPNLQSMQVATPGGARSTVSPTAVTGSNPSAWQQANSFLGSPSGQLAVGALGAGISAYSQGKQNDKNLAAQQQAQAAQLAQERESMLAKLAVEQSQNATARAIAGARPIGEAQQFAGSMARNNAILDLLGAGPATPGNAAIAQAANLGSLPRISPEALARMRSTFSEPNTLQSIATRDMDIAGINPSAAPSNYALLSQGGESPLTKSLLSQFQSYRQDAQNQLEDSESYARRILAQAIDGTQVPVGSQASGGSSAVNPFRPAKARQPKAR